MTKKNRKKRKIEQQENDIDVKKKKESSELNNKPEVPVVVFKSARKKAEPISSKNEKTKIKEKVDNFNDIKTKKLLNQLQWDVTSFGLKGFSVEERRKLERERVIKLGAKPPKREYVNYKDFMGKNKLLKVEKELNKDTDAEKRKDGNKKSSSTKNPLFWNENSKKATKIGKYKGGMLKLSQKEINKIKSM